MNDKTLLEEILGKDKKLFEIDSQCVRSVSFWSCGIRTVEHSIQNAYLHLIDSAQHFIYIEVKIDHKLSFSFDELINSFLLIESIFYQCGQ